MKEKSRKIIGYHFTGDKLRDGRAIPGVGEWLVHEGPIEMCQSGLHASEHPFDALKYAPGTRLHRVELTGSLVGGGDKWVGKKRRILASIDAEPVLREFACWCALQVVSLWNCPAVVKEFLETGDEKLRDDAWAAAWAAAGVAARDDAGVAAWVAAWAAAGDDAGVAARDAAWVAAGVAAGVAAWTAAWAAARAAAQAKQRKQFKQMVSAAFEKAEKG